MGPIWATRIWANPLGTHAEPGCTPHMGPIWVAHMGPIYACLSVSIRQKKILKVICDLMHHHKSAINATLV